VVLPAEFGEQTIQAGENSLLAEMVLGAGLPAAAEQHLRQAGSAFQDDDIAEQHLRDVQSLAPDHAAILISLYRFYFYKGRLREALKVARVCLAKAARDNGLSSNSRYVRRSNADFGSFEPILPRFYLFTLKAYAYLQMRLGNKVEGHAAVQKLLELDPSDKLNAKVLLDVWQRIGQDEES
jgi:tetratricopeptide (TPR) repeat protein